MHHKRVIVCSAAALLVAGPFVNTAHDSNVEAAGTPAHAMVQDTTAASSGSTAEEDTVFDRRSLAILLLLVVLTGLGGWLVYGRVRASWNVDADRLVPPLLFPLEPKGSRSIAWQMADTRRDAPPGGHGNGATSPAERAGAGSTAGPDPDPGPGPTSVVQTGPVRFHRPPDGTLQLLPGRLEIVGGSAPEEIRFVKLTGREPVITFGRSEGEPHAHIQLAAPTVSRMHASMRFLNGHWHIANLSETNPVSVNGRPIALNGEGQKQLADGDTVEMGQIVFRFRAR